ncbi:hypothetical protein ACFLZX_00310 [Nanoarchaeota archaeon]
MEYKTQQSLVGRLYRAAVYTLSLMFMTPTCDSIEKHFVSKETVPQCDTTKPDLSDRLSCNDRKNLLYAEGMENFIARRIYTARKGDTVRKVKRRFNDDELRYNVYDTVLQENGNFKLVQKSGKLVKGWQYILGDEGRKPNNSS